MKHYSVLQDQVLEKLDIKENGIYVDATLGLGGHSELIAQKLNNTGKLIVFDQDEQAMEFAKKRLEKFNNIIYINDNFRNLKLNLNKFDIQKIDGILYDLGTSYYQLTNEDRGFTYHGEDVKLDMRMSRNNELSAIKVLNEYEVERLAKIFRDYGDEKKAFQIARKIEEYRRNQKIETNDQLNSIIKSIKGFDQNKHPSKNIYQALRIEVNDEIGSIIKSLSQAKDLIKKEGRILVITFHSLEDRVVKNMFWELKNIEQQTEFEVIKFFKTLKVIYPTKEEVEENKASRSAKLRVLVKKNE